jgi:hypothetical protein
VNVPGSTESVRGWHFLVARGRRKGYRALLAPDMLVERREVGLLVEGLSADAGSGAPRVETIPIAGIGTLSCAYRTERVDGSDLRDVVGGPMLDEHGRPLEILYGIACATPGTLDPHPADLDDARAAALETYRLFLADEGGFVVEQSTVSLLRSTVRPAPAVPAGSFAVPPLSRPRGPVLPPARRTGLAGRPLVAGVGGGLLVLALAATAWVVLLRPSSGSVTDVRLDRPDGAVRCGPHVPVVFTASMSTDGQARVVYHWEDRYLGRRTGSSALTFRNGGTKPVRTRSRFAVTPGRPVTGRVLLVVDSPNHRTALASYTLTCPGNVP